MWQLGCFVPQNIRIQLRIKLYWGTLKVFAIEHCTGQADPETLDLPDQARGPGRAA